MNKQNNHTFKIVVMAIFISIAYISSLILPIKVQFLTLDIKDAFITIGALYFGPLSGALMSAVVSLLEFLLGSDTGVYGMIMNFIGSATFSVIGALIYTRKKSLLNAVLAMFCAVVSMTIIMLASNLVVTPLFMASKGMTAQVIEEMILPLLLPFNLFKGILNASLVMLLYKPISNALKKSKFSPVSDSRSAMNKYTFIVSISAIACVILSLLFIFIKLGGVFA